MRTTRAIPILSGGLDSTTMLYWLRHEGFDIPSALSFDYGQRHAKELSYAKATAKRLDVDWHLVSLASVSGLISSSALTGDTPVPEGHYAEATMAATVVPNRNMVMLSIAAAHAISVGADLVVIGAHTGDHFVYPDCRPEFFKALTHAMVLGNQGFANDGFSILAPFIGYSKTEIASLAANLGVPIADTWSCYAGGTIHCGRCGTCCERREALEEAGVTDPTEYLDRDYWIEAKRSFEASA